MKDQVMRSDYFIYVSPNRPGEGAKLHAMLKKAGVNLLAMHAFPEGGNVQVDLIPERPSQLQEVARREGMALAGPKTAFLIQGEDRIGALAEILERLAQAGINVTAATGLAAGSGRYACIAWVAPKDVESAARALGAMAPAGGR